MEINTCSISSSSPASVQNVPDLIKHPLQHERWRVLNELKDLLLPDLACLVANYVQKAIVFGPSEYREYYGVDVGEEALPREALDWWNSLDAITPFDADGNPIYNYETHHGFYYIPANYKAYPNPNWLVPGTHIHEDVPMDIEAFDRLAQTPVKGHPSRFKYDSDILLQNKKITAAKSYWIAPRKTVLFRKETTARQRALMQELNTETKAQMEAMAAQPTNRYKNLTGTEYENLPNLRDLTIIARAHLTKTGERFLGDDTGLERRWTFSRTDQVVTHEDRNAQGEVVARSTYQIQVGGHSPLVVGGPGPSGGLDVGNDDSASDCIGVAGLRKFSVHRPLDH